MTVDAEALDAAARGILTANDRGGYTVPTDGLYPYQWNWDSAFAALGFACFDVPRAWAELESLFSGQWDDGMVPHILFHKVDPGYFPGPEDWQGRGPIPSSGITQPPIAATMARRIALLDPAEAKAPLGRLLPRMKAWHRWFMQWRLHHNAVCVTHPWESGRDNAPDWDQTMAAIDPASVGPYKRRDTTHVDPSMRPTKADYDRYIWLLERGRENGWNQEKLKAVNPFRVADPTMTFTLLRANRDLLALYEWLQPEATDDHNDIRAWITALEAGAMNLWNPTAGHYDARDTSSGTFAGCLSNASFLCWYAGLATPGMLAHLHRVLETSHYPIPSLDSADPRFDARRYWRGPSWAMMNLLTAVGLADCGQPDEADTLRSATAAMIGRHGFAEYFDPMTGAPAGGGRFTWTAAVWLAWASPNAEPALWQGH